MYQKVYLRLNFRVHFKIELPFKLHMLMHLLVYKSAKSNSMKGELKGSLYVPFKGAPKIFFQEALTVEQKCEEKDIFDVVIDGLLDSAIKGVLEGAPRDTINDLYKDAPEATVICECKQSFVNIIIFQFFLFMLTSQKCKSLTGALRVKGRGVKTTV